MGKGRSVLFLCYQGLQTNLGHFVCHNKNATQIKAKSQNTRLTLQNLCFSLLGKKNPDTPEWKQEEPKKGQPTKDRHNAFEGEENVGKKDFTDGREWVSLREAKKIFFISLPSSFVRSFVSWMTRSNCFNLWKDRSNYVSLRKAGSISFFGEIERHFPRNNALTRPKGTTFASYVERQTKAGIRKSQLFPFHLSCLVFLRERILLI